MIDLCFEGRHVSANFRVSGLPGDLRIEIDPFGGRKFAIHPYQIPHLIPDLRDQQEVMQAVQAHIEEIAE